MAFFREVPILVRGGGDIASGAIYRLFRAGFPVYVAELEFPHLVRRTVCFGEAVYSEEVTIEGVSARLVRTITEAHELIATGHLPVITDMHAKCRHQLKPIVMVDGRMEKRNLDTTIHDAPLVIGLGPGFTAGIDCHAVIETNRGHNLGRVIYYGQAEPDTGEPGAIGGQTHARVLRAPCEGHVESLAAIGDQVESGQPVARIANVLVHAPFAGVLRGIIHPEVRVQAGKKIGDVDPRASREACFTVSDKSLAVGGGVIEAVLSSPQVQGRLAHSRYETA